MSDQKNNLTGFDWLREGNLVYALEPTGEFRMGKELMCNRFTATVNGGKNVSEQDCEQIAQAIQALPLLVAACKRALSTFETIQDDQWPYTVERQDLHRALDT